MSIDISTTPSSTADPSLSITSGQLRYRDTPTVVVTNADDLDSGHTYTLTVKLYRSPGADPLALTDTWTISAKTATGMLDLSKSVVGTALANRDCILVDVAFRDDTDGITLGRARLKLWNTPVRSGDTAPT